MFVMPLPHTTALRYWFFYGALTLAIAAWWRGEVRFDLAGRFQLLFALFALSALAPLLWLGVDVSGTLNAARNNLLEIALLVFSIGFSSTRSDQGDRAFQVLRTLSWSYTVFTGLAATGLLIYTSQHGFPWLRDFNADIPLTKKFSFVSVPLFIVTMGFLAAYWGALQDWERRTLAAFLGLAFLLVLRHQSVTPTVALIGAAFWILIRSAPRAGIALVATSAAALIAYAALVPSNQYVLKVKALAELDIRDERALSMRSGLWRYVWICSKPEAWFGHGFDSRKMNQVCRSDAVIAEAERSGIPETVDAFRRIEVSAHNIALQIIFEQGIVGLLLFLALLGASWKAIWRLRGTRFSVLPSRLFIPTLFAYLFAAMLNPMWPSNPAKVLFAVIAVALWCERHSRLGGNSLAVA